MKIYTRTGDSGQTGLLGGKRVSKADLRMHAIGTLDEVNALLGAVLCDRAVPKSLAKQLTQIQQTLFAIGTDLASPMGKASDQRRIDVGIATLLEHWIDVMEKDLKPLAQFILPGGAPAAARLHVARTVCRRAERSIVALADREKINPAVLTLVNRLSDYFFVAARSINKILGAAEVTVELQTATGK